MANLNSYGFIDLRHLANERVSSAIVGQVDSAIAETLGEYNRVVDALMSDWVEMTTAAQQQVVLPGSGTLQPLDEHGNPLPVRPSGKYAVGYPIQGGGTAWGDDRITRVLMTVAEVDRNLGDAMQRDKDWLIRHMLAAVFDETAWTFNDDWPSVAGQNGLGNITVQPLANGDSVTFGRKGSQAAAADDHYLATASAIADAANPFPAIRSELLEHPSNGNGNVVAYVASNLTDEIQGLANFKPIGDSRIDYGDDTDLAMGEEFASTGPGDAVLGITDRVRIVEWAALPSNYMIAKIEGRPFLRMRELPAAELQGFFEERHSPDGNHYEYRYLRYGGFGVYDRVGAVVWYGGGGTYAVPAAYDAPLAV